MLVAISAFDNTLEGDVNPRFGRCNNYLLVDTKNDTFKPLPNPAQYEGHGAGVSAAQMIVNSNVDAIISGNIGPNAFRILQAANIPIYTFYGKIKDALSKLKNNQLEAQGQPTNQGHVGMPGSGMGRGGGRGGGQGRRRQ